MIGDVWILGGQSNMEFEIAKVNDGLIEIASANFPEIRLLTMPVGKGFDSVPSFERLYEWSDWSNRHFLKGAWQVCTPETVSDFSAIGYIFGRRIHMASQVPIGLHSASCAMRAIQRSAMPVRSTSGRAGIIRRSRSLSASAPPSGRLQVITSC